MRGPISNRAEILRNQIEDCATARSISDFMNKIEANKLTCPPTPSLDLLKLVSAIFYQIFIFAPNNSPLQTMKNAFYFI